MKRIIIICIISVFLFNGCSQQVNFQQNGQNITLNNSEEVESFIENEKQKLKEEIKKDLEIERAQLKEEIKEELQKEEQIKAELEEQNTILESCKNNLLKAEENSKSIKNIYEYNTLNKTLNNFSINCKNYYEKNKTLLKTYNELNALLNEKVEEFIPEFFEICNDNIDNNKNNKVDCEDLECEKVCNFIDKNCDILEKDSDYEIKDIVMTPNSGVKPGQNIIANVRIENKGEKSQDSIKISVEVPELDIKESSYINNLNPQEVVTSNDMLLFVPEDSQIKNYTIIILVEENENEKNICKTDGTLIIY